MKWRRKSAVNSIDPSSSKPSARRRWMLWPALTVFVTFLLPIATLCGFVWMNGYRMEIVRSASMRPTYDKGALLVVRPIDPTDIEVGQTLMFAATWRNGAIVTHRVVEVQHEPELQFITRGDANDTNDPEPVPARATRGVVQLNVPAVGDALWALRWPRSLYAMIMLPAAVVALMEAFNWLRRRRRPGHAPDSVCPACAAIALNAG